MTHRQLIISELKKVKFGSLLDVGCGEAMDLDLIHKEFPKVKLSGIDQRPERIEIAVEKVPEASLVVGDIKNRLPYKDKSFDIVLADAVLYQNRPEDIVYILMEMKRVGKEYIILIENYSEVKDDDERFEEYNVLNYREILAVLGVKWSKFIKITENIWAGYPWSHWGHLIIAKL